MSPRLIENCKSLLLWGFIFQQDGAPAHTAKLAQDFLATNCSEFVDKDEWPPNSPNRNPLDCLCMRAMLERYKTFHSRPKHIQELKNVLQVIWDQLPQVSMNSAIVSFTKRIRACLQTGGFAHWTCFAINLKRRFNF